MNIIGFGRDKGLGKITYLKFTRLTQSLITTDRQLERRNRDVPCQPCAMSAIRKLGEIIDNRKTLCSSWQYTTNKTVSSMSYLYFGLFA